SDELALNAQPLERRGKNPPAAVHYQDFVTPSGKLGHLSGERPHRRLIFQQCSRKFDYQSHCSPVCSSTPRIRLQFCTAWPAAPLPRLSRQDTTISRRPDGSSTNPISA